MDFSKMSVLILFLSQTTRGSFRGGRWICFDFCPSPFCKNLRSKQAGSLPPDSRRVSMAWYESSAESLVACCLEPVHNNNGSSHTGKQELVGLVLTCVSLFVLWICTCTAHLSSFFFLVSQVSQLAQLSLVVLLGPWHPVAVSLNNQMPYLSRPRSESPLFAQVLGIFEGNVFLLN